MGDSSAIARRVVGDDRLRDACARIYAAAVAVPPVDRMDVFAVAVRALVQTEALAGEIDHVG